MLMLITQPSQKSKHLIENLDDFIRPLVLMLPKMSGYVKTFKEKLEIKILN